MSVKPSVEPAASVAASTPPEQQPVWTAARIVSVVAAGILGLVSLGVLSAGGWATWMTTTQRNAGYLTSSAHDVDAAGPAITSAEVGEIADQAWGGLLGAVRVRATSTDQNAAVFIGVAPTAAVDRYLAGVTHTSVTGWFPVATDSVPGTATTAKPAPADTRIWTAQVSGTGTQALTWSPAGGTTVVVMHPDGSSAVSAAIDFGAEAPDLSLFAVICWAVGALMLGGAVALVVVPLRRVGAEPEKEWSHGHQGRS